MIEGSQVRASLPELAYFERSSLSFPSAGFVCAKRVLLHAS